MAHRESTQTTAADDDRAEATGLVSALASAVGVSAAVVTGTFHFMDRWLDELTTFIRDPLGYITGPLTEWIISLTFSTFAALYGAMLEIADIFVEILRQSIYEPVSNVWEVFTLPIIFFLDSYYDMAVSSGEAAGPLAPVVVIVFFLALLMVVYAIGVVLFTALSVFIGVRLDELGRSAWIRITELTDEMPFASLLRRGDSG